MRKATRLFCPPSGPGHRPSRHESTTPEASLVQERRTVAAAVGRLDRLSVGPPELDDQHGV